jgi:hypothetical protein
MHIDRFGSLESNLVLVLVDPVSVNWNILEITANVAFIDLLNLLGQCHHWWEIDIHQLGRVTVVPKVCNSQVASKYSE